MKKDLNLSILRVLRLFEMDENSFGRKYSYNESDIADYRQAIKSKKISEDDSEDTEDKTISNNPSSNSDTEDTPVFSTWNRVALKPTFEGSPYTFILHYSYVKSRIGNCFGIILTDNKSFSFGTLMCGRDDIDVNQIINTTNNKSKAKVEPPQLQIKLPLIGKSTAVQQFKSTLSRLLSSLYTTPLANNTNNNLK
jgi:hypothetical protein